jgi:cation diffusion facilitator CzcD-associated flavoprotein CzcO
VTDLDVAVVGAGFSGFDALTGALFAMDRADR